jgi:hypothetical protein
LVAKFLPLPVGDSNLCPWMSFTRLYSILLVDSQVSWLNLWGIRTCALECLLQDTTVHCWLAAKFHASLCGGFKPASLNVCHNIIDYWFVAKFYASPCGGFEPAPLNVWLSGWIYSAGRSIAIQCPWGLFSPVLAAGRNFGRKTQKWPHKISAVGKIRGRIFGRFLKKWPKSGRIFRSVLSNTSHDYIAEINTSIHLWIHLHSYFFGTGVSVYQPLWMENVCGRIFSSAVGFLCGFGQNHLPEVGNTDFLHLSVDSWLYDGPAPWHSATIWRAKLRTSICCRTGCGCQSAVEQGADVNLLSGLGSAV